MTKQGEPV